MLEMRMAATGLLLTEPGQNPVLKQRSSNGRLFGTQRMGQNGPIFGSKVSIN